MPKHFFVFQELYTQDKFDRNVIPQQILKQKTLVRTKKRPFCTQKLFRKSLPSLTVSAVPKDFQQTPHGNTAGKFNDILHTTVKSEMKFNGNLHA